MKYSLRSLMIVAILAPPLVALVIVAVQHELKKRAEREEIRRWLERYDKDMASYGGNVSDKCQNGGPLPGYLVDAINRKNQNPLPNSSAPVPNPPKP